MTIHAKLTSKGQITLPKKLRDELGLQSGDTIGFRKSESGRYELVRDATPDEMFGVIKADIALSLDQLDAELEETRAGRGKDVHP
ncbi:MAG: AbrB/MazE/SpoVT family DNA-binding domain-containing protein [Hyphomicrobiales bacterium]